MDFGLEAGIFLAYAAGLFLIYIFGRLLIVPVKMLLKLMASSVAGGVILLLINAAGGIIGIMIPVNIVTTAVTGVLGVPGVLALLIYFNAI